jgi:hypothetical protein
LLAGWLWAATALSELADRGQHAQHELTRLELARSPPGTGIADREDSDATAAAREPAAPPASVSLDDGTREERSLGRMSPRELRRLPGIGQTRALSIARARWERSETEDGADLARAPGIGPETRRRIHEWFERLARPSLRADR